MRSYKGQHKFYRGIDLHARSLYVCVLDDAGEVCVHRNIRARPEAFLAVITPSREEVVVAVECMFAWYWLADLCDREGIAFVSGHALYMKAIHGSKTRNDRIDSLKITHLLRSGNPPEAYVYLAKMRSTCSSLGCSGASETTHLSNLPEARSRSCDEDRTMPQRGEGLRTTLRRDIASPQEGSF